jgi:hypothetical protein
MKTAAVALVASLQRRVALMISVWKVMLVPCASYASLQTSRIVQHTSTRPEGAARTVQLVVMRGHGQAQWWAVYWERAC